MRFVTLLSLFFVVACATGAPPKDFSFAPDSQNGLLVYPTDGTQPFIAKVDLEAGELLDIEILSTGLVYNTYSMIELPPGAYAYAGNLWNDAFSQSTECFNDAAPMFAIEPGKVTVAPFIRRKNWVKTEPQHGTPEEAEKGAMAFLETYTNVTAPVRPVGIEGVARLVGAGSRFGCGYAAKRVDFIVLGETFKD